MPAPGLYAADQALVCLYDQVRCAQKRVHRDKTELLGVLAATAVPAQGKILVIDITCCDSHWDSLTGMMAELLCGLDEVTTIKESRNKIMGQMNQDCICQLLMQHGATQRHMAPHRAAVNLRRKTEEDKRKRRG